MSEYQCYEFVALEQPLNAKQMAELRAMSTRAEISPTRFWNEYHWGDLKADPVKLIERYFDAHVYSANWGARRLMLRLPKGRVDVKAMKPYFAGGHAARFISNGEHVVLALTSDTEEPESDDESQGSLAVLSPVRAELMQGDLRPAYLAWLLAVHAEDVGDDAVEPPVPAGLAELTAAQEAMVEFLRIDVDLVAAAASGSAAPANEVEPFRRWLKGLSARDKDAWLNRAAEDPGLALGGELLRAFRTTVKGRRADNRRTVAEIRACAGTQRAEREKREAARSKKAMAAAEAARQRHFAKLACDLEAAWMNLEKLIEASGYDEAVRLAIDLRDLAVRDKRSAAFAKRFEAMRSRQLRRRGFFDRWKRTSESGSGGW
jgi:hypothetical protein